MRGLTTHVVKRHVQNPVMFGPLPLKLSYFFMASLLLAFLVAISLSNAKVNPIINIALPVIIGLGGTTAVSIFYQKYGIHGYYLKGREQKLPVEIVADASTEELLSNSEKLKAQHEKH